MSAEFLPGLVTTPVRCPRCRHALDFQTIETSASFACPHCAHTFELVKFDPPAVSVRITELAAAGPEGGQPCAAHARNAAMANCDRCGAFMCALCRLEIDQRVVCPPCFDRLAAEGAIPSTRVRFRDYGGLAGVSATFGCLFTFLALSILFGPLAIYFGVRALRERKHRIGDTEGRIGIWAAILLGLAETVFGIFVLLSIFGAFFLR